MRADRRSSVKLCRFLLSGLIGQESEPPAQCALRTGIWGNGTEYSKVYFWDKLVREPLELLSDCSDTIKLHTARNSSDSLEATESSTRPDFLCWLDGVLVILGEEKSGLDDFL